MEDRASAIAQDVESFAQDVESIAQDSPAVVAPPWLNDRFPKRSWASLRTCFLRVDEESGAGLDMEACLHGFHIDALTASPGQDPKLRPRDVIIAIDSERLMGLPDSEVGDVFGKHFKDGVEVIFLSADELREAEIERDANQECPCEVPEEWEEDAKPEDSANYELLRRQKSSTEYEAVVRIPVGRGKVWRLDPHTMATLEQDLAHFGERFGLVAKVQLDKNDCMQCVVLSGLSTAIASARAEAIQILHFYRDDGQSQPGSESGQLLREGDDFGSAVPASVTGTSIQLAPMVVPGHVRDIRQFMYHDHTADIIVHSWGTTRAEAFAQVCVGMFEYMTNLDQVEFVSSVDVEAKGHDLLDLLYHLLDEFLYVFGTEMHVSRCIEVLEFDEVGLRIRARGYGDKMDLGKHEQGTEIKAITMHMMKILGPDGLMITEGGTVAREDVGEAPREGFAHEVYVLLDI